MSFMSTRRSTKHVKKRLGSIQEELQKSFPTADTLPEKNAWPLGAWKRSTKTPFRRKRSRWTTEVSQNAIQSAEESCFLPTKAAPGAVATVQHGWLEIGLYEHALSIESPSRAWKTGHIKAGPPLDLSFWSFFTFLHYGIEEVERHLLWKFYKKIRKKSWSNVPPKLVACIAFLYKVVHKIGRLRKFNRSRGI